MTTIGRASDAASDALAVLAGGELRYSTAWEDHRLLEHGLDLRSGDDVLVVAGQNFYPADIETGVAHDGVRPGCVAAVAAAESGFAIVAEPHYTNVSESDLEVLARTLRAQIARSIGVAPRTVAFVPRGSLAKTPSGKLRRPAIAASLRESAGFLVRVDF